MVYDKAGSRPLDAASAVAARAPLFKGIDASHVSALLGCLEARTCSFAKGEYVYRHGDVGVDMGIVIAGGVRIENVDARGATTVLSRVGAGQVFAGAYACLPEEPLRVDVVAADDADVLFLGVARLTRLCSNACPHHQAVVANLLAEVARKNLLLSQRALHVSPKTIRGKVLAYLSSEAARAASPSFEIPFNRQELANYLGVDRSALSAELSKMQRDGLIRTKRNFFELLA